MIGTDNERNSKESVQLVWHGDNEYLSHPSFIIICDDKKNGCVLFYCLFTNTIYIYIYINYVSTNHTIQG